MTFLKNRRFPVILFVAFSFLILIFVALSLASEPFIKRQIENLVRKNLGPAWRVTIEKASVSIIPLSVTLEEIGITAPQNADSVSKPLNITVGALKVSGFSLWDYWFKDQLAIGSIYVAQINGTMGKIPEIKGTPGKGGKNLQTLKLGRFEVASVSLRYFNGEQEFHLRDGRGNAKELSYRQVDHSLMLGDLDMELFGVEITAKDKLHRFGAERVALNKARSSLIADSIFMKPLKSVREFAALDMEKSRIALTLHELSAKVDFDAFIQHQKISVALTVLTNPSLEVFRDKTPPDNPAPIDLPSEIMRKMKIPLQIDSVAVAGGSIVYHEKPDKSPGYGHIYFQDLNATVTNISNVSGSAAIAKASAYLMGAGKLSVEIKYPFGVRQDTFLIDGVVQTMNLAHINPMIVNAAFARVDEGAINKLSFRFHANSEIAEGRMDFAYSGMKVTLLKLDKNGEHLERKTRSLFANMIVSNSNPKKGDFRVGEIKYERKEKKSIFNYWWKSLFSGIKSSVGIKEKKK